MNRLSNRSIDSTIIMLLGIISYANSFTVPAQLDDDDVVQLGSGLTRQLFSLPELFGNGRWFADVTFALNRQLHGAQPFGFHLVNLLIHLATALCLYAILRSLLAALQSSRPPDTGSRAIWPESFIPVATAALFVCHPLQTQAVTYIVQRYTSLAALCYLGSLLAYLRARLCMAGTSELTPARWWGSACIVLALLAMKSKETAFTLPLLLVLCEIMLFQGELLKKRWTQLLTVALLLIIPLQVLLRSGIGASGNLARQLQSATIEGGTVSRGDYLLTQLRVVATYLRLLVLPVNQNLDYDYPISRSLAELPVAAALLLHLALLSGAVYLYRRSQRCREEQRADSTAMRLAALGICWFYLTLAVESSLIPIRDVINEHRTYLPSAGFFMMVTAAAAYGTGNNILLRRGMVVLTTLLCLTLTVATIQRNRIWGSTVTLWQDVLKKSPDKARANYHLGYYYGRQQRLDLAIPYLVRAVELEQGMVVCWNSLSTAVSLLPGYEGRAAGGERYHITDNAGYDYYRGNRSAWQANCYNSLGVAYEYLGDRQRAGEQYRQALLIDPALDLAWYNSALLALHRHDQAGTAAALERLKTLNPQLMKQIELLQQKRLPR